eukprot:TRINITY_DN109606_c0_g1_i1.p1 TRINITY_DN109606_c0_g1~~TRINITY_DN109606_c0_g1_i1.p1  ORF type:complete len:126 (-),score=15.12 TRINITY_DN109606_c0_g1_i1:18-395(-)
MGANTSACCSLTGPDKYDVTMNEGYSSAESMVGVGEVQVVVDRSNGDKLGLDVEQHQDGISLRIDAVRDGLISAWNQNAKNIPVGKGDRIVAVNGKRGDVFQLSQLVGECQKEDVLTLVIKKLAV